METELRVGENAGRVWELLNREGKMSFSKIKKRLDLSERTAGLAIGWLMREGKLQYRREGNFVLIDLK